MGVRIGIDSGGTFTDVMAVGEEGHNSNHEGQLREILLEEHPSCFLCTSSETLSEFREYERCPW